MAIFLQFFASCISACRGPSYLRKKGTAPTQFLAHVYCGQTAGWIKMPLGMEVNLGPGDVVLDGVAAPPKRGTAPVFVPCLLWPNGWMDEDATSRDFEHGGIPADSPSTKKSFFSISMKFDM